MDRVRQADVILSMGVAVEICGDLNIARLIVENANNFLPGYNTAECVAIDLTTVVQANTVIHMAFNG